jgi:hypothetical protein
VQASASGGKGGTPTPSVPRPPATIKPGARPSLRPMTASGQVAPDVTATNAHCGQTVTATLTLNGDLFCSGDALTVSGTSVVLNLAGHELGGDGTGDGVQLTGKSDTVENGLIINFSYGVDVQGTTDTVSAVRSVYNFNRGIMDVGTGTKITNSVAANNVYFGILSYSVGGVLSGDHELNNGTSGLELLGQKQTVTSNVADGNVFYGILDQGFGTTLTKNVANFNHLDGILISGGDPAVIDGAGNTAKGNDYATGATPEQCSGVVCS